MTAYDTGTPSTDFATGRSMDHRAGRHWSGPKQNPHRTRLGCGHEWAEPGQVHRLLTDPERGCVTACEPCYERDTRGNG